MLRFALRRAASALLTLLGVLALVFGLVTAAPGDAAALAARALPATLALNTAALLLATLIGVPLGVMAARRPGGRLDRISGFVCAALFAPPTFLLGLVFLLVFSGWLRVTPLFADTETGLRGFLLPVATLALASLALIARFVRVCVAAALADPAALAGRARGERPSEEIRRAFRRSSAAFAAMGAVLVPSVVSGSILVERVFSLPGAGGLLAEAVFARDLPPVLALPW